MSVEFKYGSGDPLLVQYLEEKLKSDPASSLFAMLAYNYLESARTEDALSVARQGVASHPHYSTGHAVLAAALIQSGLLSEARQELQIAASLHPGSMLIESYQRLTDEKVHLAEANGDVPEAGGNELTQAGDLTPGLPADPERQEEKHTERPESPSSPGDQTAAADAEDWESADELQSSLDFDSIARELDSAGPIKPVPEDAIDSGEEGGIQLTPDIVTDTLATIFEQQGKLTTAIEAYKMLAEKKPENAEFYRRKISELSSRTDARH